MTFTPQLKHFDIEVAPLPIEDAETLRRDFPGLEMNYETECPTCHKNRGMYVNGTVEIDGALVECPCRLQVNLQRHYLAAGIGAKYHRISPSDWTGDESALAKVGDYCANLREHALNGEGLFISGKTGVGKTTLATFVAREAVKQGYSVYFTTVSNYISLVRAGWRDNEIRRQIYQKTTHSKVLVLDDMYMKKGMGGKVGFDDEHTAKTVEELIRTRAQAGQITIITSNIDLKLFRAYYGNRLGSLLDESCIPIHVDGDDKRKKTLERGVFIF